MTQAPGQAEAGEGAQHDTGAAMRPVMQAPLQTLKLSFGSNRPKQYSESGDTRLQNWTLLEQDLSAEQLKMVRKNICTTCFLKDL